MAFLRVWTVGAEELYWYLETEKEHGMTETICKRMLSVTLWLHAADSDLAMRQFRREMDCLYGSMQVESAESAPCHAQS